MKQNKTISFVIDEDNDKAIKSWIKITKLSRSRIINLLIRRALEGQPKYKNKKYKEGDIKYAEE